MNIMDGIKNFLTFVNSHWTEIVVVIGLGLAVGKKVVAYLKLSDQEKIQVALAQVRETMLKLVTNAEMDYNNWVKAGAVKRAEVIDAIFQKYPVLNRFTNQEKLIAQIDQLIDEALVEMRKVFEENTENIG